MVTLGGIGCCYTSLALYFIALALYFIVFLPSYKLCDNGLSTPSSHRMMDNPFLGQYTLKSQEIRKWGEIVMESGKYGQERYDSSQGSS